MPSVCAAPRPRHHPQDVFVATLKTGGARGFHLHPDGDPQQLCLTTGWRAACYRGRLIPCTITPRPLRTKTFAGKRSSIRNSALAAGLIGHMLVELENRQRVAASGAESSWKAWWSHPSQAGGGGAGACQ